MEDTKPVPLSGRLAFAVVVHVVADALDHRGPVGLGSTSATTSRLGLRGKWPFTDASGMVWQPYVQANIWRDWGGEANTSWALIPCR